MLSLFVLTGVGADEKADYSALSKMIQDAAVANLPRQYEEKSPWGMSVPIDPFMRLQGLRMRMNVNGRDEWPHGVWKRLKLWMVDPARDLSVEVRDLRKLENGKHRLTLTATVSGRVEHERQRWRNGIQLFQLIVHADGVVAATFDCDVAVAFDASTIPPAVSIEPKVVDCRLELKDFQLHRVGPVIGDGVRDIGHDLRDLVAELVRSYEPKAQELANAAIAKALKDGKGKVSADLFLKATGRGTTTRP
jgi:hypothetical protein